MLRTLVTAAILLVSAPALGQTVNAESLVRNPYEPGWAGKVSGSLAVSRGNIDLLDVGGEARVSFQTVHDPDVPVPFVHHRFFTVSNGRFAEREDAAFIDQLFGHARWAAMWHPRIGSELFAQVQRNEFLQLRSRFLTGAGARTEIVHLPAFTAAAGSGYMFEHETIGTPDGEVTSTHHRWTSYVIVRANLLDDRLLLQNTIYVQPRFDAFDDHRILAELQIDSTITELLSLGVSVSEMYDSRPPEGVTRLDLRLQNNVTLSF